MAPAKAPLPKSQKTLSSFFTSSPKINKLPHLGTPPKEKTLVSNSEPQSTPTANELNQQITRLAATNRRVIPNISSKNQKLKHSNSQKKEARSDLKTNSLNLGESYSPNLTNSESLIDDVIVVDLGSETELTGSQFDNLSLKYSSSANLNNSTRPIKKAKIEPNKISVSSASSVNLKDFTFNPNKAANSNITDGKRDVPPEHSLASKQDLEHSTSDVNEDKPHISGCDLLSPSKSVKFTPLETQVIAIKKGNPDVLLVVEVGYKFQFFGNDAVLASKVLGIYCFMKQNFMSCSIPSHRLMLHVRRLVYAGYKVGVVRQAETVAIKSAGNNKSGPFSRKLTEVYTRGTLIGEVVDSNSNSISNFNSGFNGDEIPAFNFAEPGESGYILSVVDSCSSNPSSKEDVIIGIIAVDPSTGSIIYDEFTDNYTRIELETRIAHLNPVEMVLANDLSLESLRMITNRSTLNSARVEKLSKLPPSEAMGKVVDEFTTLNACSALDQVISELKKLTLVALELSLRYLKQYGMETVFCSSESLADQGYSESLQKQFMLSSGLDSTTNDSMGCNDAISSSTSANTNQGCTNLTHKVFTPFSEHAYMRLDARTLRSLEIFGNSTSNDGSNSLTTFNYAMASNSNSNSPTSLFSLLNHTVTPLGGRTLFRWIQKPLLDSQELSYRLQVVQMVADSELLISANKKGNSGKKEFVFDVLENDCSNTDSTTMAFAWLLCKVKPVLYSIVDLESGLCRVRCGKANPAEVIRIISSFHRVVTVFANIGKQTDPSTKSSKDSFYLAQILKMRLSQNTVLRSLVDIVSFKKLSKFIEMMLCCINRDSAKSLDWANMFSFDSDSTNPNHETFEGGSSNYCFSENSGLAGTKDISLGGGTKKIDNVWNKNLEIHRTNLQNAIQNLEYVWSSEAGFFGDMDLKPKSVLGIEYLIEITNAKASKVPESWIKISGTKALSRFHTPEIIKAIKSRDLELERLILESKNQFRGFCRAFCIYYVELRDLVKCLGLWDAIVSLGYVARFPGYTKPQIIEYPNELGSNKNKIVFYGKGIAHPVLSSRFSGGIIPNDVDLQSDGTRALILTGPNMGGKSTYVRTVGLVAIMAQIGSYVPADELCLTPLDAIYTRMGAQDMIMENQSTFMIEMRETCVPLEKATSRSLVILDELGRGTGTVDGSAIACATLEYFLNHGSQPVDKDRDYTKEETSANGRDDNLSLETGIISESGAQPLVLFVTHYAHVVKYFTTEKHKRAVKPCYVEFIDSSKPTKNTSKSELGDTTCNERSHEDEKTQNSGYNKDIVFLYRLAEGVSDDSYGVQVAKMAGLPQTILDKAYKISTEMKLSIEAQLEQSRRNSICKSFKAAISNEHF